MLLQIEILLTPDITYRCFGDLCVYICFFTMVLSFLPTYEFGISAYHFAVFFLNLFFVWWPKSKCDGMQVVCFYVIPSSKSHVSELKFKDQTVKVDVANLHEKSTCVLLSEKGQRVLSIRCNVYSSKTFFVKIYYPLFNDFVLWKRPFLWHIKLLGRCKKHTYIRFWS